MKKLQFDTKTLNSFRIKDTMLDRRYKSTPTLIEDVRQMYKTGDWTQEELAYLCGVSKHSIYRWLMNDEQRERYQERHRAGNRKYRINKGDELRKRVAISTQKTKQYKNELLLKKLDFMS